jgi:hypothetical protein
VLSLSLTAGVVAACSSPVIPDDLDTCKRCTDGGRPGEAGDDAGASTAEDLCAELADGYCTEYDHCLAFDLKVAFGDRDNCKARYQIYCQLGLTAPGTSLTAPRLAQCASDRKGLTCDDVISGKVPDTCVPLPGALDEGKACVHDAQCKTTFCQYGDAACGVCAKRGTLAAPCHSGTECESGLSCVANKCTQPAPLNATCDGNCDRDMRCVQGKCAAPLNSGASCTFTSGDDPCDVTRGDYCNTKTNTCTPIGASSAGDPCSYLSTDTKYCTNSTCDLPNGQNSGTCVPLANDGNPCGAANRSCRWPARCATGTCTLPSAMQCL